MISEEDQKRKRKQKEKKRGEFLASTLLCPQSVTIFSPTCHSDQKKYNYLRKMDKLTLNDTMDLKVHFSKYYFCDNQVIPITCKGVYLLVTETWYE